MKITDYCHSGNLVIHLDNVFRSSEFKRLTNGLPTLHISEHSLENENLDKLVSSYHDTVVTVLNFDIDFPPPRSPYKYDTFLNKEKLPLGYENIDYYQKIHTSLIPIIEQNNLTVFAHACSINCPSIIAVPIGVYYGFSHLHLKSNPKTILCYANFGIPCDRWFGNPRKQVGKMISNKPFIHKENIQEQHRNMNNDYFYDRISRSKFAICPRGCGLDTYRLWDCIALGCIPIVERYESHSQWADLPILFLDSIHDYENMTEEFLEQKYAEFMARDFSYDKLTLHYWLTRIKTSIEEKI